MNRYHIKTGFEKQGEQKLQAFTDKLNRLNWIYSIHCLDNLRYRLIDRRALLIYIKSMTLDARTIFEYYTDANGLIWKACYRFDWKGHAVILVVSNTKNIITIYTNAKDDDHVTLNTNLYIKEGR
jgi:hypothetical protein